MNEDPERLLAEALRAQAARTPLPAEHTQVNTAPGLGLAGSGYGLLSGDVGLAITTPHADVLATRTARIEPRRRVPALAILLLAMALGLAAGAVAGLLTLL